MTESGLMILLWGGLLFRFAFPAPGMRRWNGSRGRLFGSFGSTAGNWCLLLMSRRSDGLRRLEGRQMRTRRLRGSNWRRLLKKASGLRLMAVNRHGRVLVRSEDRL